MLLKCNFFLGPGVSEQSVLVFSFFSRRRQQNVSLSLTRTKDKKERKK